MKCSSLFLKEEEKEGAEEEEEEEEEEEKTYLPTIESKKYNKQTSRTETEP